MITRNKFEMIKEKYGFWASWAVWAEQGETPKSNVGDLSIFDSVDILSVLNPNVVFVGLNISRGAITTPLANFHDKRSEATDFKIRYAFKDTRFWGGYMTDIIKDYDQLDSVKVIDYLRENKEYELENIKIFNNEIKDIGAENPTLIAFGTSTKSILDRYYKKDLKIIGVTHYAHFLGKEKYREEVLNKITIS
jgi:hypothetical protein